MSSFISKDELEIQIERIARYSLTGENSFYRGLYTKEWAAALNEVEKIMNEAGLITTRDPVGNLYGKLEGEKSGKTILTGSHIDTVINGGKYDGLLGILAGIEALRQLKQTHGKPKVSLEVVAFCEEEGSRFNTAFWGSKALLGRISAEDAGVLHDTEGITIEEAMLAYGLNPREIAKAARSDIEAFIELHIEQGGILEELGKPVGIVEAITGMKQYFIEIVGEANHAGTTPMHQRYDTLQAAALMISAVNSMAERRGSPAVATVGYINVTPGSKNVIPGKTVFSIDFRHPDRETHGFMESEILNKCREIAEERKVSLKIEKVIDEPPVRMDGTLVEKLEKLAKEESLAYHRMVSGAGHDSSLIATEIPTAMIFVPSKKGISHSPGEYTASEEAIKGIRLLSAMLHHLAYEENF